MGGSKAANAENRALSSCQDQETPSNSIHSHSTGYTVFISFLVAEIPTKTVKK